MCVCRGAGIMLQGAPESVGQAYRPWESRACLVSSGKLDHVVASGQGERRHGHQKGKKHQLDQGRVQASATTIKLATAATDHPTDAA